MTLQEFNAMHEAAGTPKVWVLDWGFPYSHRIHSKLFLTEEEAKAEYDAMCGDGWYRKMYQSWDIWGFAAKQKAKA